MLCQDQLAGKKKQKRSRLATCLCSTAWPGEVGRKTSEAGFKPSSSLAQSGERNLCWATPEQMPGSGATPSEECNNKVLDDNQGILQ